MRHWGKYKGPARLVLLLVDALDDSGRDDARTLVLLLSKIGRLTNIRLRCLVTSRPETPIRAGFKETRNSHQDLILQELPRPEIRKDIDTFLRCRLDQIRTQYNGNVSEDSAVPASWPSTESIERLVEMAIPLFIFASTVCRFIADHPLGDPEEQMDKILRYDNLDGLAKLHLTYLPILNNMILGDSGSAQRSETEKAAIIKSF